MVDMQETALEAGCSLTAERCNGNFCQRLGSNTYSGRFSFPFFLLTIHQNLAPILTKALVT